MFEFISSILLKERFFYIVLSIISLIAALVSYLARKKIEQDSKLIHFGMRSLIHEGKSPKGLFFYSNELESLWRRILAFYNGAIRASEAKGDILKVLSSGSKLIESEESMDTVLKVLSDLVYRTSAPEAKFVSVVILENNNWVVKASSGISSSRLEDPAVIVIEKLPLDGRSTIYTRPQNGMEFDFRGLGVGMSLFVPMYRNNSNQEESNLIGIVWIGFSEQGGPISEQRRSTIELVVQNATTSFLVSTERYKKTIFEDEKKEQMLSLSHDMKAPGARALYALRELDESLKLTASIDQQMLVKDIEYALEEQLGMIQGLFNIDSISKDSKSNSLQEFEVSTLIKNRIDSFKVVSRSMGIELNYIENAKGRVKITKDNFYRILDNLISNSLKYSPKGNIIIKIEALESNLKISVIDDGIGVDEELRPLLFSSKIRSSKEVPNMGNRYGLTAAKKLVEELGGNLGYSPNVNKGSCFWFTIPAINMYTNFPERISNNSILLIDDDAVMRRTHSKWLEGSKYSIKLAASFFEARQIIEIDTPKLIIADVNIPGEELMDFLEFIPSDISLIILSGRPEKIVKLEYGTVPQVKKILEKPVNKNEFLDNINLLLDMNFYPKIEKAA